MNKDGAKQKTGKFSLERPTLGLFVVLGGVVMVQSARLSLGNLHNPGPGFMPFLLGISMIVFSVLSYMEISTPASREETNDGPNKKPILFIFGGLTLYLVLMDFLGFYVTTFLLLIHLMRACGEERYGRSFWISGLTVVIVYLVFFKLFVIPFPEGVFGI